MDRICATAGWIAHNWPSPQISLRSSHDTPDRKRITESKRVEGYLVFLDEVQNRLFDLLKGTRFASFKTWGQRLKPDGRDQVKDFDSSKVAAFIGKELIGKRPSPLEFAHRFQNLSLHTRSN